MLSLENRRGEVFDAERPESLKLELLRFVCGDKINCQLKDHINLLLNDKALRNASYIE